MSSKAFKMFPSIPEETEGYGMSDPCFTLRLDIGTKSKVIVRCFDDHFQPNWDSAGRVRLTYEVTYCGKVIFPKGQLYGAIHGASDSITAKEHCLSHLAMYPGDGNGVDDDFYEGYTDEQKDFVITHGDAIGMEREARYCDSEGNPRKARS